MANDPVCGKFVDPEQAVGQSTFEGKTYFFCSAACKERFDQNPERYAGPEVAQH